MSDPYDELDDISYLPNPDSPHAHLKPEDFFFAVFKDGDDELFGFSPRTYWEKHKALDDSLYDVPGLPRKFGNEMEAVFSYNGKTEDGIDALLKAGFLRSLEMEFFLQELF